MNQQEIGAANRFDNLVGACERLPAVSRQLDRKNSERGFERRHGAQYPASLIPAPAPVQASQEIATDGAGPF